MTLNRLTKRAVKKCRPVRFSNGRQRNTLRGLETRPFRRDGAWFLQVRVPNTNLPAVVSLQFVQRTVPVLVAPQTPDASTAEGLVRIGWTGQRVRSWTHLFPDEIDGFQASALRDNVRDLRQYGNCGANALDWIVAWLE